MKKIGRYELLKELGSGAMGVVYAAMDPLIGRQVAIKTIRLGALDVEANHAEMTRRLHREARAAGVLSHPGIITIHDVGEQGDEAYIVMELVDGKTVEELLASGVPQRSGTWLSILKKTAAALDYAHSKGIVHRDIKPSNIMICPDRTVKIADFGVAKLTASASLTQSGFVLGTPSYMSPEQAQGREIDGRSDQFSLGVVAYRMLSGALPFEGPTLTALLAKILWEEPQYEGAGLKPPVQTVFKRALSKDPRLRFPNCGEFVRELEDAYAKSKTEALSNIPLMTEQNDASAGYKNIPPVPDGVAQIPVPAEAAESMPEIAPPSVLSATRVPKMPATGEDEKHSQPSPSVLPEIPAQGPKRKFLWIPWAAALGILFLAAIAFLAIKEIQIPAPRVQTASTDSGTAPKSDAAEMAPAEHSKENAASRLPATPPVLDKTAISEPAAPKPRRVVSPRTSPPGPASGVITWSGELAKNSILVITGQESTIGRVVGQLPGKPVIIEVEPEDLAIRQKPGEVNRWNQIMLFSGNKSYSSITIRWKII